MSRLQARPNSVSRFACIAALAATLASAFLHFVFGTHAGALWRDEIGSIEIATMQSFSELWSNLAFESFPALFTLVLRAFATALAPVTDNELRVFGVTIGLLILAALWLNARWFRIGFPLISLALIGSNAMIIRYGDSIRGYGLGMLTILLSLGTIWRLVELLTWRRALIALVAALLSVHALYYNSVLLFAICMGAISVTLRRKNYAQTFVILAIGGIAALSLLPYLSTVSRVREWDFVWKAPVTFANIWTTFSDTLGSPLHVLLWVWPLLVALSVVFGAIVLWRSKAVNQDRLLFALVTMCVGGLGYAKFLRVLGYQTQPWYFITLLAFVAFCCDIIFANAVAARALFCLTFSAITFLPASKSLQQRQTNLDLVAARLTALAVPEDFIVANPFPFGISLHRYYRGATPFATLPPLSDLRTHRADELKLRMRSPEPIAPVLQKMEETLRAGHTVWLVGSVKFLGSNESPLLVEPGELTANGWTGGDFYRAWSEQAGFFLQTHADQFEHVRVPLDQAVMHYENVPLSSFHGWHESGTGKMITR